MSQWNLFWGKKQYIFTLCQLLKVFVAEGLEDTGWSLGDGDGLSLPRGDARRRHRGGAAVLRHTAEDLAWQKKTRAPDSLGLTCRFFEGGGRLRTFLCCSIRISTTIFWNFMSNMAATVSTWALISVGPKMTAMLEGVMRLSSLWLQTLWTDTEPETLGTARMSLWSTDHDGNAYVTKCLISISSINRFFSGNL